MEDRLTSGAPPALTREERFALTALLGILLATAAWWSLALWPVQPAAPYWLLRTRLVCFGADGNGLPDAAGWIGLIGQPIGMLGALWVGWSQALRDGVRHLLSRRRGRLLVRAFAFVVIAAVLGVGHRVGATITRTARAAAETGLPATYPRLDLPAPPTALLDQHGAAFTMAQLRGRPVIVTFAYAHCQTICPLVVQNALVVQREGAAAASGRNVAVVVITLDPWRDTPARLAPMAAAWGLGPDAYMLGGSPAAVTAALDEWQVPRERDEKTGSITHPALSYIIDANGRIAYASTGAADALRTLLARL